MADYAEINNFPPELSSGGDKNFYLHNYLEYLEYTSGFFFFFFLFFSNHDFFPEKSVDIHRQVRFYTLLTGFRPVSD
ncbi:hypothetical protein A6V17_17965 [Escherichia coli]|nr:hypothetical protein A6V17_17965 [Escherichia coli]